MAGPKAEWLDHAAICKKVAAFEQENSTCSPIEMFSELASTNAYLLERATSGSLNSGAVCLAEQQTAGRGRRGRAWVSPAGCGIYLSLYWEFVLPAQALAGLSLIAAVVVAEVLQAAGIGSVQLKWPNDLVANELKLGGILIELTQTSKNSHGAVVGVGINQCTPITAAASAEWAQLDQPWTGWEALQDPAHPLSRNDLAATLIARLRIACADFAEAGFTPWISRWERLHRDQAKPVRVDLETEVLEGVALGLNPLGGLRIAVDGSERVVYSGDVARLRPQEAST